MFKRFFIFILSYLFLISFSFAAIVTHKQTVEFNQSENGLIAGFAFNADGTKMFTSYNEADGDDWYIREYNLSTPYDISTRVYAGDSERCLLEGITSNGGIFDLEFTSDGKRVFFVKSAFNNNNPSTADWVYGFKLDAPYNLENCSLESVKNGFDYVNVQQEPSQAGNFPSYGQNKNHIVRGVEISDDGKKLFLIFFDNVSPNVGGRLYEFNLYTPFDLSSSSFVTNPSTPVSREDDAGIELHDTISTGGVHNPTGLKFSPDGKRIFIISYNSSPAISQISLDRPFDTSSFTFDGALNLETGISPANNKPRGVTFSANGLKLYIGNDNGENTDDHIMEYDLACPFNIVEGGCRAIQDKDRVGIAEAQITVAKRTIDSSTDSVLNRLQWIRRNKDNQNLSNLDIDFNLNIPQLDNPLINTLVQKIPEKITAHQASFKKEIDNKKQDVFYWSEGSVSFGRIGDTNISSSKIIETDAITFGSDRYTDNNGIFGAAFRFGKNDIDVGNLGSNLDTDTYNLSLYATSPIIDDKRFLDTVFGVGKLKSDILSVVDGQRLTADRTGHQLYGTIKVKDEIKKDNFTLIPSWRFDIGHTILDKYRESGLGAISVKKQVVKTKKLGLGFAIIDDLPSDKHYFRKHGKLEYVADFDRSSNFEHQYVSDPSSTLSIEQYSDKHNLKGELGLDIVLPNNLSIFMIYERNQTLKNHHDEVLGKSRTNKIHLALGYLPNEKTNYAFNLAGSENLGSEYKLSKIINDFEIDFKLNNQDVLKPNSVDQASINLIRKF